MPGSGTTTITKTSEILNLDVDKLIKDYKKIEAEMVGKSSIYHKTVEQLNNDYETWQIPAEKRAQMKTQLLSQLAISHTAKAVDTALQAQQVASQLALSQAEIDFNKARTKLVEAQTETEKEKKNAVIREVASFDDNLRIKEAENLTNAVFGYASGGVAVPANLQTQMLNAIDAVTPEKDDNATTTQIVHNNLTSVQEHIDTKFTELNTAIVTLTTSINTMSQNFESLAEALKKTP